MSGRRVCFYAPLLYPLWSGGRVPFTGGAEVQQAMLATGLAKRGFDVTIVTCDYGQPETFVHEGVTVRKAFRLEDGLPGVRFFYPRLWKAWSALNAAAADAYYVRGASLEAGVAYEVARQRGARFVFGAAHDHDARRSLPLLKNPRDRWWYRRALRGADAVIAQTGTQQKLFASEFGVKSTVIRNIVEIPEVPADSGQDGVILWLATYKPSKRPEWFIELARAMPQHRFVMAGVVPDTAEGRASWEQAQAAGRELKNLTVRGYVPREEIGELYRSGSLFVHTSPAEGFPNTVLEAWAYGLPTVTCVDPDGVVAAERLGLVAKTTTELVTCTRRLMDPAGARRETGTSARAYAMRAHGAQDVLARMIGVLDPAQ